MPRIPYFDLALASPAYLEGLADRPPLNLYRMLPYAGALAPIFLRMGGAIRNETVIDPALREIAIVRVGVLTGADYEVHHHLRLAREAGVSEVKASAIAGGADAEIFSPLENLVLEFTDALVRDVRASDELFGRIERELGREATAELVLAIGFYLLVSRFLLNFGIEIETPEAA